MKEKIKPVTVYAGTVSELTNLQQEGLDHVVDFLTRAFYPGPMMPLTCRIIIEWGNVKDLEKIKEDAL